MNDSLLQQMVDAIFEKVERRIEKRIGNSNVELTSQGIVTEVSPDGTTAKVDVGFTITEFIPNCSGSDLAVGSVVKVFYDKRDMRDAYIGVRFAHKEKIN